MKQLIWDLPTRLFHWLLAASVLGAFGLGKLAHHDSILFNVHIVFGVLAGLLITWRVLWGLIGSKHARFSALFFSPAKVLEYFASIAKGKGQYHAAHNPGGSVAIVAILGLVALSVISGLGQAFAGEAFEEMHEAATTIVIFVVAFHVAGVILATRMNKENYVLAMITGKRRAEASDAISHSSPLAAAAMMVLVAGGMAYFLKGYDVNSATFSAPGTTLQLQLKEEHEGHGGLGEHDEHGEGDHDEGHGHRD